MVDNDGASGARGRSASRSPRRPRAPTSRSSPPAPDPGQTITLTSASTDPDDAIVATDWDLDDDGTFTDATGATASRAFAPGTHHVHVRVTDNDGNFAVRSRNFTIFAAGAGIAAEAATADEGTPLRFPVRLNVARSEPVYVDYETSTGLFGTLVFAPGQTLKHVVVLVGADGVDTVDRTVTLTLSQPSGAPLAAATATGTVKDVDAAPRFVLDPVNVRENAGTATLTVRLEGAPTTRAISGRLTGYGSLDQAVTITPPARSATVPLTIADDAIAEADEIVTLSLTHPETAPATATLTIRDDEPSGTTVSAAPSGPTPEGAGAVNVTVALDHSRSEPTTLHWTLAGGSTEHTTDWAAREGDVTVPAGATSAVVALQTVDDDVHEAAVETWALTVGSLTIPVPQADDEPEPVPSLLRGDPAQVITGGGAVAVRWSRLSETTRYIYDVTDSTQWTQYLNAPAAVYRAIEVFHTAVAGPAVLTQATSVTIRCGGDVRGSAGAPAGVCLRVRSRAPAHRRARGRAALPGVPPAVPRTLAHLPPGRHVLVFRDAAVDRSRPVGVHPADAARGHRGRDADVERRAGRAAEHSLPATAGRRFAPARPRRRRRAEGDVVHRAARGGRH